MELKWRLYVSIGVIAIWNVLTQFKGGLHDFWHVQHVGSVKRFIQFFTNSIFICLQTYWPCLFLLSLVRGLEKKCFLMKQLHLSMLFLLSMELLIIFCRFRFSFSRVCSSECRCNVYDHRKNWKKNSWMMLSHKWYYWCYKSVNYIAFVL